MLKKVSPQLLFGKGFKLFQKRRTKQHPDIVACGFGGQLTATASGERLKLWSVPGRAATCPGSSHRRKPSHLLHFCPSPRVALSPNHQPDYSLPALRVHQQLPTTPVQRCPALPATLQSLFFLGTSTWFQSSPHGDRIVPQGPAQIPSTFLSVQISWPLLPLKTCPVYACFLVPSPPSNCRLCEGTKQALHRHAAVERLSPPHENAFLVKDIPPWPGLHSSGR
jgi:hypothetical protein